MGTQPATVRRARFPSEYGTRGGTGDEPWAWADVEQRLRDAPNYWIATVTPEGRPHARPVDGVWVEGSLCFGGSPETRWARNLAADPAMSAHLPGDDEVVILEGRAELITDPAHPLVAPMLEANVAKYPQYHADGAASFGPFWMLRPAVAYAWSLTGFPKRATRWTFEEQA